MKLTIFYSWQLTTQPKYNKYFIYDCIQKAIDKLKKMPEFLGIEFNLKEAVREESGSVPIADTIVKKIIPDCDIFISDLSVVSRTSQDIPPEFLLKIPPFLNQNVLYELGVARNSLGYEKLIGVSNSVYGSPKEDNTLFPFDIRHLRFPIEYSYSSANEKEKSAIQNRLIASLTNALKTTALFAIENLKNKYSPFVTWTDWETQIRPNLAFLENERIKAIHNEMYELLNQPTPIIRFIGLSGLGKTRILLETFRNKGDNKSRILSSRVLYYDYNNNPNLDLHQLISTIIDKENDKIIIVDNCPIDTHKILSRLISNKKNGNFLITIDSNPEEYTSGGNYIILKKEELKSVAESIIENYSDILPKETKRKIIDFSQGIPLMAVLLADSIKNGEQYIGRLEDKDLLDKLLGIKGKEEYTRTILRTCSLFKYIGYEESIDQQLAFVATNKKITTVDGDQEVIINKFREICNHYLKREIFERKGRYIGMRPYPLAISLAQEWLETCTSRRLLDIILDIAKLEEPHKTQLSKALCDQMSYLNYSDKAQEIIENIVGEGSPFDNAEVLNTELGSRLFRSFSEVNPNAVLQNFIRNFSTKTTEELLFIREGRRNIVWTLEKLCFNKSTFTQAVKILYQFAIAENERISNNATGQFLHLFRVLLAGTEANLLERLAIIKWGIQKKDSEYKALALKAMKMGLGWGSFMRINGAEEQGGKVLKDYYPDMTEIADYWKSILFILFNITKAKEEMSEIAEEVISKSIFGICKAGCANIIIPIIEEIAEYKNYDWDYALKDLKRTKKILKYDIHEYINPIEKLITKLTKTDFTTRYLSYANSYYLEEDTSYSPDKLIIAIENLADEFIDTQLSWDEYFPLFYSHTQTYSYYFGKRIYEKLKRNKELINNFIDKSLIIIKNTNKEKRNISVLSGFIHNMNDESRNEIYDKMESDNNLDYLLFNLIPQHTPTLNQFDRLFKLVNDGKYDLESFEQLRFNSLNAFTREDIICLSKRFFKYGNSGYDIAFDVLFSISEHKPELKEDLLEIMKDCIYKIGFQKKIRFQLDNYKWHKTISELLENEAEIDFAKFINTSLINSISLDNLYHLDQDAQRLYEVLMKKHFNSIWNDLSIALLSKDEEYLKFYGLKHILGSSIGGFNRETGVLFDGNIEMIFDWCKDNQPLAPIRLAELVPIFGEKDTWHPITLRLINEFGTIPEVLNSLDANMGTFSWSGSIIPLLESQKQLFIQIQSHSQDNVSQWANLHLEYLNKRIKEEKIREEEMFL